MAIVNRNRLRHAGDPGESGPTWRDAVDGAPLALVALAVVDAADRHGVGQGGVHAPHGARRGVLGLQPRLRASCKSRSAGDNTGSRSVSEWPMTNASAPEMTGKPKGCRQTPARLRVEAEEKLTKVPGVTRRKAKALTFRPALPCAQ